MTSRRLLLSSLPLAFLCLACGFGPIPCDEARPARARELQTLRGLIEADRARFQAMIDNPSAATQAYGGHSAAAGGLRTAERRLEAIDAVDAAWRDGDETAGATRFDDLTYLCSGVGRATREQVNELRSAVRAVEHCTE